MKRQSLAKSAGARPLAREARGSSERSNVSLAQALSEAPCSEIFSIVCCCLCVFFTFTCAFFMPEISVVLTDRFLPEGLARSDDRPSASARARAKRSSGHAHNSRDAAYAWRNDSDRACAQACLHAGAGSVFLQPFSHSYAASSAGADGVWALQAIVQAELCSDPSGGGKRSVFANALFVPFDARLLDPEGLVLVAEMRAPQISDRAAAAAVARRTRAQTHGAPKAPGGGARPANKNAVAADSANVNARVLANVPRGYNADRTTTAVRRAKRVLSSFDLVLLGAWEADPSQRRALLSVLRGPVAVDAMTDAQVAAALGLPNDASPFAPPTDAQVAAAALPFQKHARNATTPAGPDGAGPGGGAGEARRWRQVREQTDVDVRLFHHAAALSTAAFRATRPGACSSAVDGHQCALVTSATNAAKCLADRRVCGNALAEAAEAGPVEAKAR